MSTITQQLETLGTQFAFDTETALAPECFKPRKARLLQFHSDDAEFYFDVARWSDADWAELKAFMERPDLVIIGHNLLFDYKVMLANGVQIKGKLRDTMVQSRLIDNGRALVKHGLAEVARRWMGRAMDKEEQAQDWTLIEVLSEKQIAYSMDDVRVVYELAMLGHERVYAEGLWNVYELECALIPAVAEMEHHGICVDREALAEAATYYSEQVGMARDAYLEVLDNKLKEAGQPTLPRDEDGSFNLRAKTTGDLRKGTKKFAGYNISSSRQTLAWWQLLGVTPKDDRGKASTDKKVIARYLEHDVVRIYSQFRKVEKRLQMAQKLGEHMQEDGRIRASFNPLITGTGRFSASNPNLQQVPRDKQFRCAFVAPQGRSLVQADYAAMELRVAAAIANVKEMLEAFAEDADIHTRTATLMYDVDESYVLENKELRQNAKAINFAALYGSAARGVRDYCTMLGIFLSVQEAQDLLGRWHRAYPGFKRWHQQCNRMAEAQEPVRTVIGRKRHLFGDDNRLTTQANNVVQGTSADIMKCALVEIHRKLPSNAQLIATVHDEVLVECDEAIGEEILEMVLREMEEAAVPMLGNKVRIKAEGGVLKNWGDK